MHRPAVSNRASRHAGGLALIASVCACPVHASAYGGPAPATPTAIISPAAIARTDVERQGEAQRNVDVHVRVSVAVPPGAPPADTSSSYSGSHFFAEVYGGASTATGLGLSGELTAGVGGRPWGMALRFYLIGQIAYSTSSMASGMDRVSDILVDDRKYLDLAVGARMYIPIYGSFRLFADVLGGPSDTWSTLQRDGTPTFVGSQWVPTAEVAAGAQFRVVESASFGVRVAMRFTHDALSDLRGQLGLPDVPPVTVTAGLTWHL